MANQLSGDSWKDQLKRARNRSGKSGKTFSKYERDDIYFYHLNGRYGRSYWNVPADNFYVALMEKTDAVIEEIEQIKTDKQIAVDMAYLPNFAVETFVEAVRQKGWLPVYVMPDDRVYGVVFNDQFSKGARRAASAQL